MNDSWRATDGTWRATDAYGRRMVLDEESLEAMLPGAEAFASAAPAPPEGRILVAGAEARHVEQALAGAAVPYTPSAGPGDLVVVALPHWDTRVLKDWNIRALDAGFAWLPCGPFEGPRIHVGPLVLPRVTACYACYLARRLANTQDRPGLEGEMDGRRPGVVDAWPLIAWIAAAQAKTYMRGGAPATLGHVLSLHVQEMMSVRDEVLRVPRCRACSRLLTTPARAAGLELPRGTA